MTLWVDWLGRQRLLDAPESPRGCWQLEAGAAVTGARLEHPKRLAPVWHRGGPGRRARANWPPLPPFCLEPHPLAVASPRAFCSRVAGLLAGQPGALKSAEAEATTPSWGFLPESSIGESNHRSCRDPRWGTSPTSRRESDERRRICSHSAPPLGSPTQPPPPDAQVSGGTAEAGRGCIYTLTRTWQRTQEGSATCTWSKCVFPPRIVLGQIPRQRQQALEPGISAGSPEATKVPSITNV